MRKLLSLLIIVIVSMGAYGETIILKSGKKVEGRVIEKTAQYIKMDFYGTDLTYYLHEIETIDGAKVSAQAPETKSVKKENLPPSNEFGIVARNDIASVLTDKNNNALIHYKSGKLIEAKITRKFKGQIMIEASAGVELGIKIQEIDYIETSIPDTLQNRYVNTQYGITVQGPLDWVMVTPEGYYRTMLEWSESQLVYFHKYPIEDKRLAGQVDPFISIVIDNNHPGINSALEYAFQRAEVLKRVMPDLKILAEPSEVIVRDGKWAKLKIESRNSNLRQENYFLLKNDLIYWVSFGAPPDSFEAETNIFKEALNSIEIN